MGIVCGSCSPLLLRDGLLWYYQSFQRGSRRRSYYRNIGIDDANHDDLIYKQREGSKMEQIIKKLESAYEDCVQKKELLVAQEADLNAREEKFNAKGREMAELVKELQLREAEVKKVEDPMALLESIKLARRDLLTKQTEFDQREASLRDDISKDKKEISDAKVKLVADQELVAKELSELKKSRKDLEDKKAEMKAGILKDLAKKL